MDLLGPNTVYSQTEHRRQWQVGTSHDHVYYRGQMLPKAVTHSHANERSIEEQHGTDMREAGIESLKSLFPGSNAQNCLED